MTKDLDIKLLKNMSHVGAQENQLDSKFRAKLSNTQSEMTRKPIDKQNHWLLNILFLNMVGQISQNIKKKFTVDVTFLTFRESPMLSHLDYKSSWDHSRQKQTQDFQKISP